MNRITPAQVHTIQLAHADGLLDNAIAERAGVSIATVKRYRTKLGLETHCVTTLRGREGERRVAEVARLAGLEVQWRERDGERHDLIIGGLRVDVKAAMQDETGTWRFSLPTIRASYYGRYSYPKDYEQDCEVVALVCLRLDGLEPSIYLLGTTDLLEEIRIRPGLTHQDALEAWDIFGVPAPVVLATRSAPRLAPASARNRPVQTPAGRRPGSGLGGYQRL